MKYLETHTINVCRLCSKKYKTYSHQVISGDSTCCDSCNDEVNKYVISKDTNKLKATYS